MKCCVCDGYVERGTNTDTFIICNSCTKREQEKIREYFYGDVRTETSSSYKSESLTEESVKKAIEKIFESKIEIVTSKYLEKGKSIIIDFEKLREKIPYVRERGKLIYCNSEDYEELKGVKNDK